MPEFYYRVDFLIDEDNVERAYVQRFTVIKKTPCGAWIQASGYNIRKRFILDSSLKKYAYPTIDQARAGFVARKLRQIQILKWKIECAERGMEFMKTCDLEKVGCY
jgi:hypothetical protein